MHEYRITANRISEHSGEARGRAVVIPLDTSLEGRQGALCAPELLLSAVGGAVLAGVERAAAAMAFALSAAAVQVHGVQRSDAAALAVDYELAVETNEPEHRLARLHEHVWRCVNLIPFAGRAVQLSGRIRRGTL